jgi:Sec-independent protein translocase protein TatA
VRVLFGAKRVPEISASLGMGMREFKRNLNEVEGAVASQLVTLDDRSLGAPHSAPTSEPARRDGSDDLAREPRCVL